MQPVQRTLLSCLLPALLVSACGDYGFTESDSGTSSVAASGTTTPVATAPAPPAGLTRGGAVTNGTHDSIVAVASVPGTVSVEAGSNETISVTFTSSDGQPITGFAISGTTLPADWSGLQNYNCTQVGAGSTCVVTLTYAPAAVESGSLSLNYEFIDNAGRPQAPGGSLVIPYAATTGNNIVASAAPIGQVSAGVNTGAQSVAIDFTTDDGNAATDLMVTSSLSSLPAGWSSSATSFSCAIVSTGNGCLLALGYAPAAPSTGTLTLNYSYTDDTGTAKTGAINVPYSSTTNGNVVATFSPSGQVTAVEKTGKQTVTVTFDTVDGQRATDLAVLSDLKSLPSGWSSGGAHPSCAAVSTCNGCQLSLEFAPTGNERGTLSLNYGYLDAVGTYTVGSLAIPYAATTDDNVSGAAAPSGQISVVVGQPSQPVTVTFTTDDGRPATALDLTTDLASLPAGWSSVDPNFSCSGLSSGTGCQLPLVFAPTAAGSGSLTLAYSYTNDAGNPKTGSLSIPYRSMTDDNVVGTPSQTPLTVTVGSSTNVNITFTTDDGNPATAFSITSGLTPLPADWTSPSTSLTCASVSTGAGCQISLTYAPLTTATGTLTLGFTYTNNAGIVKSGTAAIDYSATP
jgi:hypothetical protein